MSDFNINPTRTTPTPQIDSLSGASISKRREFRRKRNRIRRIILISISIVLGIILALIATDIIKLGTGPRPSLESQSIVVKKKLDPLN